MRIAILNWNNRRFGGTGSYLSGIMPALHAAGHQLALWHEVDTPIEHPVLSVPVSGPTWSIATLGLDAAVKELRAWIPDLLYAHGFLDPAVERRALDVAPAVFFAHNYYGTCISGLKTWSSPHVVPCTRTFGWQCMARYYPNRCGGLSPVTMVRMFRRQSDRLDLLSRYAAIVTHSDHMQQEYINHGLASERVFHLKYAAEPLSGQQLGSARADLDAHPWRLLFVGRMDRLKGGHELLQALPDVSRRLARPLELTFAGDGPERNRWEAEAEVICCAESQVRVQFLGWVPRDSLDELYRTRHLLVFPSLWPEPLGLVGLEAGQRGLPVVAFDVGGVSDWLQSGTNGLLAPGNPPTIQGLADAIVGALGDTHTYRRMCQGAQHVSRDFDFDLHLRRLLRVFDGVVQAS